MKRFDLIFSLMLVTGLACSDALLASKKRKTNPVKLKKKNKLKKEKTDDQHVKTCGHCNKEFAGKDIIEKLSCNHTVHQACTETKCATQLLHKAARERIKRKRDTQANQAQTAYLSHSSSASSSSNPSSSNSLSSSSSSSLSPSLETTIVDNQQNLLNLKYAPVEVKENKDHKTVPASSQYLTRKPELPNVIMILIFSFGSTWEILINFSLLSKKWNIFFTSPTGRNLITHLKLKDQMTLHNVVTEMGNIAYKKLVRDSWYKINNQPLPSHYLPFSDESAKVLTNVAHYRNITHLNIRESRITEKQFIHLVKQWPELKSIQLARCYNLTNKALEKLVKYCPKIKFLGLIGLGSKYDWENTSTNFFLSKNFGKLEQLEDLDLGFCNNLTITHLTTLGAKCPQLKTINLRHCDVTEADIKKLLLKFNHLTKVITASKIYEKNDLGEQRDDNNSSCIMM